MTTRRSIHFFHEDIGFRISKRIALRKWIESVVSIHNKSLETINYIFCSDEYLLKVNIEYLDHDYYTDIISFQSNKSSEPIEGDIYISIDRVKDNAKSLGNPFLSELHRVMIHGVLHFVGFKDKTEDEKNLMRKKEDEALSLRRF